MMTPMYLNNPWVLVLLVVLALVIFGTSRLAGIGKTSGKAIREFREEMDALKSDKNASQAVGTGTTTPTATGTTTGSTAADPAASTQPVHEAEVVEQPRPDTRP